MGEITKRIYQDTIKTTPREDKMAANRCPRKLSEEARGLLYEGLRPFSNSKK